VVSPAPMRFSRALVAAGSLGAVGIAAHTAINLRFLRTPPARPAELTESVDVLIPARNEDAHIERSVRSVLAQVGVPLLRVLVLDDGSTDNTAAIVRSLAEVDPRVLLLSGADAAPPLGWLGKPWACARLAEQADAAVVTFVDADVELLPHAIAATVQTLREGDFAMVAPYPFQVSESWLERLIQPLVTWSWAATMPLRWAENSTRPSLSAANGQLLVLDSAAYRSIGGHGAVRADVLEDIGLMRALKSAGRRTATVDGSKLARCRMYAGQTEVVDGYTKSLWSAFNGPVGSVAACSALGATLVLPAVAAVAARDRRTRAIGLAGYAAGVVSRGLVARRTGERLLPDVLTQPASIAAFIALNIESWRRHVRGTNTWKGRSVTVGTAT
jgi:cellulose synthase/poly-beta-1,6-N-acetylglucosamine synthase-like glycosyltransferase